MTGYEKNIEALAATTADAIEKFTEFTAAFVNWFVETAPAFIQRMVEVLPDLLREQPDLLDLCPNRRVLHLAKHGKKYRTRKKNLRRAYRLIDKEETDK